jgi:predicted nucleotidyltransferase component of viral defense system
MKDHVLELVAKKSGFNVKLNLMREYLQFYILRIMHDEGVFRYTAFLGGTALRFLHGLPRYSEDLDFSCVHKATYTFSDLMKKVKEELVLAGYSVEVVCSKNKVVNNAFVKFEGLMYRQGFLLLKIRNSRLRLRLIRTPLKAPA